MFGFTGGIVIALLMKQNFLDLLCKICPVDENDHDEWYFVGIDPTVRA